MLGEFVHKRSFSATSLVVLTIYLMSEKKAPAPGDGLRSLRSTGIFRAVNFELYAKPVSITSNTSQTHSLSVHFNEISKSRAFSFDFLACRIIIITVIGNI